MLSQTKHALKEFDNQHEFERMAADILNGLGYSHVEPMAPGGGPDGGRDIKFREGALPGIAFVTLEKRIEGKFKRDLGKQKKANGVIALFCSVEVSPAIKLKFAKASIKKGYRIQVFDLERLRSLLDSNFKEVRRRYLKIDDEIATKLRSEVKKLLHFPDAIPDHAAPATMIETLLTDRLPRRVFDILMRFEATDVLEVPKIGKALHDHLKGYYEFLRGAVQLERELLAKIGQLRGTYLPPAWNIYLRYVWLRLSGLSSATIIAGGNFLNYGVLWDDAEKVFTEISSDQPLSSTATALLAGHNSLSKELARWRNQV